MTFITLLQRNFYRLEFHWRCWGACPHPIEDSPLRFSRQAPRQPIAEYKVVCNLILVLCC